MAARTGSHAPLLLAQSLLERAEGQSKSGDPLDRMISLMLLQQAVEGTVRTVASELEVPGDDPKRQFGLTDMLRSIDARLKELNQPVLPMKGPIGLLNTRRNLVQHAGDRVSSEALDDCLHTARSFMTTLFLRFFDVDLSALSKLDLVENPDLRNLLLGARKLVHLETPDLEHAYATLHIAFSCALASWADDFMAGPFPFPSLSYGLSSMLRDVSRDQTYQVALLATGVNPLEADRLRRRSPIMGFDTRVTQLVFRSVAPSHSTDEIEEVESFVLDAILKWQRAGYNPQVREDLKVVRMAHGWVTEKEGPSAGEDRIEEGP